MYHVTLQKSHKVGILAFPGKFQVWPLLAKLTPSRPPNGSSQSPCLTFIFISEGSAVTSVGWAHSCRKGMPSISRGSSKCPLVMLVLFLCILQRVRIVSDGEIYLCVTSPYKEL